MPKAKISHPVLDAIDARRRAVVKVLRAIADLPPDDARQALRDILGVMGEDKKPGDEAG